MGPRGGDRDVLGGSVRDAIWTDGAIELDQSPELDLTALPRRSAGRYLAELLVVGLAYFVIAKAALTLASIHPSATPIWPPTGLALAAVMLCGNRIAPAVFVAALLANATTAGSISTSVAIAFGNTMESVVGAHLIERWSGGVKTFDTPAGVARFALISLAAATTISATIGVGSLTVAGYADASHFAATWMTWWLGDLAGALVITPVLVLWATGHDHVRPRRKVLETACLFAAAIAVGVIAFSPLIGQSVNREPLGFLVIWPLLWAALRHGQRNTATVALVLSCFAVWGTMSEQGPFVRPELNESFLLLLTFMISTCVPTLVLSADVAVRERTERGLRKAGERLDRTVQERTAALQETREALHQAQKMEALGQLTGGIAHDFNNVLTAIINSLEAVRAAPGHDRKIQASLDRALQAARNGASLVQEMLIFARRHPLQLQAVDINQIIESALGMFRRSCPESIEVRTALQPNLGWARADPTQLQMAILNLATNAWDAMPYGGTLTIRTLDSAPAAQLPAALAASNYVCIEVSDTGVGMTPEIAARAFEPFFTTKEIGKGTGLGLSMVYSTTQQMGGDVTIESRSGEGTSVRMCLPTSATAGEAREGEPEPAAIRRAAKPPPVLYVEDDVLVSLATVDMLERVGYPIHAAPNAERALTLLQEHPEIELMVTDVGLPGMNGHELAAAARRLRPDLRVLFLTGYDRTHWIGATAEMPDPSHLGKPYQERDLLEALERLAGPAERSTGPST